MARTFKDSRRHLAFRRRERALKRGYLRDRNPRHKPIYPWDEYCPACKSEIFEEGITLACPTCGWNEVIEDLVTESKEQDVA